MSEELRNFAAKDQDRVLGSIAERLAQSSPWIDFLPEPPTLTAWQKLQRKIKAKLYLARMKRSKIEEDEDY